MVGNKVKGHLALFSANLIYGINYLVAKGIMPNYIGPSGIIVLRALGAGMLFWLLKSMIKERVERKDFLRLILAGLFGVALNQILFFEGLNLTSPINASIIMVSNPIFVLVLSSVLLKERITKRKLLGVILGTGGAVALITLSNKANGGHSSILGDSLVMLNAICYGVYLVIVKPLMQKYNSVTVISWVFLFGSCFVLLSPFAIKEVAVVKWSVIPVGIYFSILFVVFATTFLAYLCNIYGLKQLNPFVTSSYIYLQPIIGSAAVMVHAMFISKNTNYMSDLTWEKGLYSLLIFLGVFLIIRPGKSYKVSA